MHQQLSNFLNLIIYVRLLLKLFLFVFSSKLELICYLRTEFDPLSIIFSTNYDNVIHSLEQKVSQKVSY